MEVASPLFPAKDEGYLTETQFDGLLMSVHAISGQIAALSRALNVAVKKVRLPDVASDATRPSRQSDD